MEAFEYAIKKDVRNNPIVREVDEARQRDLWKSIGVAGFPAQPIDTTGRPLAACWIPAEAAAAPNWNCAMSRHPISA